MAHLAKFVKPLAVLNERHRKKLNTNAKPRVEFF